MTRRVQFSAGNRDIVVATCSVGIRRNTRADPKPELPRNEFAVIVPAQ
jgi:hypothetical protein